MGIITTEKTSCRDCYKCIRHCPVKAIRLNMGHAEIVDERCIKDGKCTLVCPQGAKKIHSEIETVQEFLKEKKAVVASLAPSFIAAFPDVSPGKFIAALRRLGFSSVRETAEAAHYVAMEHLSLLKEGRQAVITSSCPAINSLIYTYYPHVVPSLAPVVSPMIGHARMIRKEWGEKEVKVVFIGPCLAKKSERLEEEVGGEIDAVLTFNEIREWIAREKIDMAALAPQPMDTSPIQWARAFPVEGGLLKTASLDRDYLSKEFAVITGIDRCMNFLDDFEREKSGFKMVELMSCDGGCIDGPLLDSKISRYERRKKIIEYAENSPGIIEKGGKLDLPDFHRDFEIRSIPLPQPNQEELKHILSLTGKFTTQDELNCGACGYDTCRDKAIAVFQGLAEAEMCIPYMRARAESFSSFLIAVTPNGIMLVDENMRIVDLNPALRAMLSLKGHMVVGKNVEEYIDPSPFVEVLRTKKALTREVRYSAYDGLVIKLSVFYLEKSKLLMGIFVDLTQQRAQEKNLEEIREKTLQNAQQVVANQMMVAQEIASLLGETTAETKSLLSKLGKILRGEVVEE